MNLVSVLGAADTPSTLPAPHVNYLSIGAPLVLVCGALVLLLLSSVIREKAENWVITFVTACFALVATGLVIPMWQQVKDYGAQSAFAQSIVMDQFSVFFSFIIGISILLSSLVSWDWLTRRDISALEFAVMMLFAGAGAMLMVSANDLIVIFVGLEVLSLPLYVLVGFNARNELSREAALKYFILGAFASAVFVYGIALTYGATGSTNLTQIGTFLGQNYLLHKGLLFAGMMLMLVGFAFKIGGVPFHQWVPDVYQGAPSPVTGFMAAAVKAAAFAALIRVFASTLYTMTLDWQPAVLVIALLTIVVGSVVACVQSDVKRMLAYSSISHAGFILFGLQAANADGISGSAFYLLAYVFMVIGSFTVLSVLSNQRDDAVTLASLRGLGRRQPLLAFAFSAFLLAQAGVPLTAGFLAKFYVVAALVENGSYVVAVLALLVAVIAAFFYLRIVGVMFENTESIEKVHVPSASKFVLAATVVMTIGLGIMPSSFINVMDYARVGAEGLF